MYVEVKQAANFFSVNFQFSLAEAEERAKIAAEYNAQLKFENTILIAHAKTLQNSVQKLQEQCHQTHKMRVKLTKVSEKSLVFICTLLQ